MSEATFKLAYGGDAVSDGEMDVSALAPALLGLGQLLKAAARVIDGDSAAIAVRVKSTQNACFEVWLSVAINGASAAWTFWKTPDAQAAATLLSLIGISGGSAYVGVIGFVRWLKGKSPEKIMHTGEGNVIVEVDGVTIEVPEQVARIGLDPTVRSAMETVIAEPLESDGIDTVSLGDGRATTTIEKSEAEWFRAPVMRGPDEFVSRHTKAFSISTLSFKPGQKWKLSDGHGSPKSVTMSDTDFLSRVDRSDVAFAKGDILICEVVETSRRTASGFKIGL